MKRLLIRMVKFYQRHISAHTTPSCRFYPTCSNYAIEALSKHGALKGMLLSAYRILRCNPLCKGGYDPVPEPKRTKGNK